MKYTLGIRGTTSTYSRSIGGNPYNSKPSPSDTHISPVFFLLNFWESPLKRGPKKKDTTEEYIYPTMYQRKQVDDIYIIHQASFERTARASYIA